MYTIEDVWVRAWLYRTSSLQSTNSRIAEVIATDWYQKLPYGWTKESVKISIISTLSSSLFVGGWAAVEKAFLEDINNPMFNKETVLWSYMNTFAGKILENGQYLTKEEISKRLKEHTQCK